MKKFIIMALMAFVLVGCGNRSDYTETTSTTESVSVENFFEINSEEEDTVTEESSSAADAAADLSEDEKNAESSSVQMEEVSKSSPVDNVSNSVFVDVSSAVRNNCNSTANANGAQLKSNWTSMVSTNEEQIYVNTALNLIDSYARLNNCRKLIYDNNDVVTDEDIALLTEIEDGLGANVEIFLNTNTTSIMYDADFDYSNELDELELSLRNKAS